MLFRIFMVIVAMVAVIWGGNLMHVEYTKSLDLLFFVKTGKEVSDAAHFQNSGEALKTVLLHLALIVTGVLALLFSIVSPKHNKAFKRN